MIIDTTLREGAQQFGTYFDISIRKRIISGLARLGVEEIELGWVGQDGLEELAVWASKNVTGSALSVWTPCRDQDLRAAAALPVDRVNIGVPVSDAHITTRLGLDRRTLVERATKSVLAAKLAGIRYVSVGLEDLSRADVDFALSIGMAVKVMGASRIRLADTVGVLTPLEMADLVKRFRDTLDMDIAVHCHDDFGMGTGNGVAALAAGADYADGSLLGIGERSGIAKTEELAAWREREEGKGRYDMSGVVRAVRPRSGGGESQTRGGRQERCRSGAADASGAGSGLPGIGAGESGGSGAEPVAEAAAPLECR